MTSSNNPFEDLFKQMSREFEDAARRWEEKSPISVGQRGLAIDLHDEGDAFVLTADVPGCESEDINIELAGSNLEITAHRESSDRAETDTMLRSERFIETTSRTITLPEPVEADEADATCSNGILTITLPKKHPQQGRRIDITEE